MLQVSQKTSVFSRLQCKSSVITLLVLWSLGFICGLYVALSESDLLLPLIQNATITRQSIFGVIAVIFIPIAVSGISIYCSAPVIIYIYSIFKGFCFSFCLCCVATVYGHASWLVRILLLFTDSCSIVFLLWLWYRCLCLESHIVRKDLRFCTILLTAIGLVDYFFVSPYLVLLMNYS